MCSRKHLVIDEVLYNKHMSQAELSRRANVNQSSLSRIMNGREPAFPKRGKRIAEALGWSDDPAELFKEAQCEHVS